MVAVEFASPGGASHDVNAKSDAPNGLSTRITKRCLDKGLLLLGCSMYEVSAEVRR
jgi:4-aminobutyrate aminotransferase